MYEEAIDYYGDLQALKNQSCAEGWTVFFAECALARRTSVLCACFRGMDKIQDSQFVYSMFF